MRLDRVGQEVIRVGRPTTWEEQKQEVGQEQEREFGQEQKREVGQNQEREVGQEQEREVGQDQDREVGQEITWVCHLTSNESTTFLGFVIS